MQQLQVLFLKFGHFLQRHVFKQAVHSAIYHGHFVFYGHGMILGLDEQALVLAAFVDDARCHGVDVAAEFGERFELAELSLVDFRAGRLTDEVTAALNEAAAQVAGQF